MVNEMIKDEDRDLNVSVGNTKMGAIKSVSLPPVTTCGRACEHCYALKLYKLRKTVRNAYDNNLALLKANPEKFYRQLDAAIKSVTIFRIDVSGDFVDYDYFSRVTEVVRNNPHCKVLAFTKRYNFVNKYIDEHGELPENFKVIMSAWRSIEMENPHNLPTAHVLYRDGYTTAPDGASFCGGNCMTCVLAGTGCWNMKKGDAVIFRQH